VLGTRDLNILMCVGVSDTINIITLIRIAIIIT
jgi:hypothetical protein